MNTLALQGKILSADTPTGPVQVDLAHAIRVRMYDTPLTRGFVVSDFELRGVYPLADGIRFHMANIQHGIFIPVIFKADPGGFRVIIPAGQIVEQFGINRKILAIDVLPDLMTSRVNDDGFFLIPCFSGTLVRFSDHQPSVNRDRIYMDQAEWEKVNLMNCFAMKRGTAGVLAIVHRGDFFCHVVTELNQEGANRIYASFGIRHTDGEVIKQENKEITFRFLAGKDAEYRGMARAYREYLVRERGVSPLKARVDANPVLKYATEAMRTKIFMGHKPFSLDGNVPMNVYATFEQAEAILDAMHAAGITKAVVTLVGWNLGGHDGAYPTRFPVEPALGGEDGLRRLIAKAKEMGYQIVPHDNVNDVYRGARDFDCEYIARTEDGQPRVVGVWGGGQSYKACPVVYYDRWGGDAKRIYDLGFTGCYYMDAQASVLWRCHDPRHPADEEQYAISLARLTQLPRALYGAVSIEFAPAYTLPFIDEAASISGPNNSQWNLSYLGKDFKRIVDRIVPFYHIAVHGLVTYQESWVHAYRGEPGGPRKGLLRALALGARPSMEVSWGGGSNGQPYGPCISDVLEFYKIAFEQIPDVHAETIEEYDEISPEARRIVYANGCTVSVNWGETAVDDLPPMSYRVERD